VTSKKIIAGGIVSTSLVTAGVGMWLIKLHKARVAASGNLAEAKVCDLMMTGEPIDVGFWTDWMVKAGLAKNLQAAKLAFRKVMKVIADASADADKPE
jgi:hypothetical protein